jgi:predicted nucleic acid-binding protein
LYAHANADDAHHDECRELFESHPGPLLVPVLVLCEVTYLLESRLGSTAEIRFIGDLAAGNFIPEPVAPSDWLRIAALVQQYSDLPLGTVDASVVAAAERLGITEIATLDRRHFAVVAPLHVPSFELRP